MLDPLNRPGTPIGYPGNAGIGGQLDIGMSPAISAGMINSNAILGSAAPTLTVIPDEARCACGCNGVTGGLFVQGHDAKLHSLVKRNPAAVPQTEKTVAYLLVAPWMTPELWWDLAEFAGQFS